MSRWAIPKTDGNIRGSSGVITIIVVVMMLSGLITYLLLWPPHNPSEHASTGAQHGKAHSTEPQSSTLASYTPPFANGLITNEFATYNSGVAGIRVSPVWSMTSGSLFALHDAFWTGNPDSCNAPNASSSNCTNSNVFRLNSVKAFSGSIKVSLKLKQNKDIHNSACDTDDTCWHGTHVWLRYQNQYNLYYVSVNRADGQVVIKRKVPCGTDDSGTYFVLGNYVRHGFKPGMWNSYTTTIQTNKDKSVTIKLYDTSYSTTKPITIGTDRGGVNPNWSPRCTTPGHYSSAAYTPITDKGNVGIRGDFANFEFTNFRVTTL